MDDIALACVCLLVVLFAGALRAFLDKNITIFYLSLFVVMIMIVPLGFELMGFSIPDGVLVLLGMILLAAGTCIEHYNHER